MDLLFCMYNELKAQHIQHEFRQQSNADAYLDEIRTLENQVEDLNLKLQSVMKFNDDIDQKIDRKIEKLGNDLDEKLQHMMSHIGELLTKSE